ncbi:MAG: YihY/virulence factor BrkB family protein [Candidatus Poribacteria bacterium]
MRLIKSVRSAIIKSKYFSIAYQFLRGTILHYLQHNCPLMSAGMSFFGLMSLIPLVIIAVSILGYVIGSSEIAQQFVAKLLSENFPSSAQKILEDIYAIISSPDRNLVDGISFLGLIWSGTRFFNILQGVLNIIWVGAKQRRFLLSRAFGFLIFAFAGIFFWLSYGFNLITAGIDKLNTSEIMAISIGKIWFLIELIAPFLSLLIMLFFVYTIIPNVKVSVKSALIGASFSAFFIEISKRGFNFAILKFNAYGAVYGPLAGFIIFITWLHISMQILLLGAEIGSQCQSMFFSKTNKEIMSSDC